LPVNQGQFPLYLIHGEIDYRHKTQEARRILPGVSRFFIMDKYDEDRIL